jgi:hypothetical protein
VYGMHVCVEWGTGVEKGDGEGGIFMGAVYS